MTSPGASEPEVRLRRAAPADDSLLADLFGAARPELDLLPSEHRAALTDMQWHAQVRGYASTWPAAVDWIVECAGAPVGRLLVDTGVELTVVDLAVLPAYRGRGVASAALRIVLGEADRRHLVVRLRVARGSPARDLYERLGFTVVAEGDPDLTMARPAATR